MARAEIRYSKRVWRMQGSISADAVAKCYLLAMKSRTIQNRSHRNSRISDALRAVLFLGDALLFAAAQFLVFWLRLQTEVFDWLLPESAFLQVGSKAFGLYLSHFLLGTFFFLAIGLGVGAYSRRAYLRPHYALGDLLKACALWVLVYLFVSLFFKVTPPISRSFVILAGVLGFAVLTGWRMALNRVIDASGLVRHLQERVLVAGWSEETADLWRRSRSGELPEFAVVGVLESAELANGFSMPAELPVLGRLDDLADVLQRRTCDALLLSGTNLPAEKLSHVVQTCHREMVRFMVIPDFFQVLVSGLHVESLRGVPVLSLGKLPLDRFFSRLSKRVMDIIGGTVGLLLSLPAIVLFAILVKRESPGPAFYRQVRVGRGGQPFGIIKIRSMQLDAEAANGAQWADENDGRRLRVGAFMRKWNIDELPQFWNVLKGDMSLVGPRPERPEFTKDFKHSVDYYNVRHTVKPGLTGWAAVNGWRGNTDLNERIRFDLDYIERWSLLFDVYIMLLTFSRNKNAY
jgi:exopolysaccharide biosynthesis polyprenyl glycosylphosphotransferase